MISERASLSEILGPWEEPDYESGLIARCREGWTKPLVSLTNRELATYLGQKIAVEHLLPVAKKRIEDHIDDDTEIYEGELVAAISDAEAQKPNQPPEPTR